MRRVRHLRTHLSWEQRACDSHVLPPPVQFSRVAVRRIACALLNKLQAAQLLPYAGTFGPPSERSSRVFSTRFSRVSSEHQPVESWSAFDAPRQSAATRSFETTAAAVDSNQPFPRKTSLHVPRESGLRANSCVMPGSELNMAAQLGRLTNERMNIQHVSKRPVDWRFRFFNQSDLSNTPSQLASMVSLDSRTDQLIQQELQNLPLDTPNESVYYACVLPPPVQFSRVAVRRIACALLNKLQAAQLLPYAGTFGPPSERSSRVFSTRFSRVSSEHQPVESWSAFDAPRQSAATRSFETTAAAVDSNQPFPRKTSLHVPRESGLRANSCVMPGSELNMAAQLGRLTNERMNIQHVSKRPVDWRFRFFNQSDLSNTPSQLASMVSLDSRTDQLIQQELQNLPLDTPTKASIMRAVRIELGRPKYQLDLFYPGSRRSSDRTAGSLALEGRVGEMEAPHPDLNKPASDMDGVLYRTRFASVYREPRNSNTSGFACDQSSPAQHQLAPESGPWNEHTWIESVLEADAPGNEVWNYLRDMLDMQLLRSCTFILLLAACSLNMLVLPVPYYFLPLLLEFGGRECTTNRAWCPHGLPHRMQLEPGWLHSAVRSSASSTSIRFLDPGSVLLVIGLANATGRLLAGPCKFSVSSSATYIGRLSLDK
ncbi:hypothetical protein AHF37_03692 [Paragonimus kellicotti]|nr:hypothetical protein AHF37_03692 [Paragonimus kellicotti]